MYGAEWKETVASWWNTPFGGFQPVRRHDVFQIVQGLECFPSWGDLDPFGIALPEKRTEPGYHFFLRD